VPGRVELAIDLSAKVTRRDGVQLHGERFSY
jgi:hypothetical protein